MHWHNQRISLRILFCVVLCAVGRPTFAQEPGVQLCGDSTIAPGEVRIQEITLHGVPAILRTPSVERHFDAGLQVTIEPGVSHSLTEPSVPHPLQVQVAYWFTGTSKNSALEAR